METATREIDLVIPMVFTDDTEWQRAYAKATGCASSAAEKNVRFRSWGTEELLVRCCLKYMPWLRSIVLLLADEGQWRGWMDSLGPTVRVVYHREFIPDRHLPCFTSPTIEMFLHRIPGLAEHFIYGNDDMFPLSPLEPEDFFRDGIPCLNFTEKKVGGGMFFVKCAIQSEMIARPFGVKFKTGTYLQPGHTMMPLLKSTCEAVWQRHGKEIERRLSPTRRTSHSYNYYIFGLQQWLSGESIRHTPKEQYAGPKVATGKLADIIRDPEAGIVCLNDNEGITDWQKRAETVRQEIAKKLGEELDTRSNPIAPDTPNTRSGQDEQGRKVDVLIVHYNTPELTAAAIRSLWKHTPCARVTVFDNSDRRPFCQETLGGSDGRLTVVDNTRGQCLDLDGWIGRFAERDRTVTNNFASARHSKSVDWCLRLFPEGMLLMDSDVLVKKDVTALMDSRYAWTGQPKPHNSKYGIRLPRVLPFLCYINTAMMKAHDISYCNEQKMYGLTRRRPHIGYDTGCWFYEACQRAGLPKREVNLDDYILHLGHGSWKDKDTTAWLQEHRTLWE